MRTSVLVRIGRWAQRSVVAAGVPWTNVYGLARTLLALSIFLTLVVNPSSSLFLPRDSCSGPATMSIVCVFSSHLEVARWIAVLILLIVASGWRPRITGVFHWWIAFSLRVSMPNHDGGDLVTAVLCLLLVPITLTDGRRWHWQEAPDVSSMSARLVALSTFVVLRLQIAVIYFISCVSKFTTAEWLDGTALYYWINHPRIGVPHWEWMILKPLLTNVYILSAATWGTLLFELLLFMALVMPQKSRDKLLPLGIGFHIGIGVCFGLITFSISMAAALILYLRAPSNLFRLDFTQLWHSFRQSWMVRTAVREPSEVEVPALRNI
jgi:antimicrobial peptide system SdpB family protein